MTQYRFLQLDVFTDHAFSGNPLAVFPEAEGLSDEVMMKIAREMNLSETVFVLNSDNSGVLRRLRGGGWVQVRDRTRRLHSPAESNQP